MSQKESIFFRLCSYAPWAVGQGLLHPVSPAVWVVLITSGFVPFFFTTEHHSWHLAVKRPTLHWGHCEIFMCLSASLPLSILSFRQKKQEGIHSGPHQPSAHYKVRRPWVEVCLLSTGWSRHKSSTSVISKKIEWRENNSPWIEPDVFPVYGKKKNLGHGLLWHTIYWKKIQFWLYVVGCSVCVHSSLSGTSFTPYWLSHTCCGIWIGNQLQTDNQ